MRRIRILQRHSACRFAMLTYVARIVAYATLLRDLQMTLGPAVSDTISRAFKLRDGLLNFTILDEGGGRSIQLPRCVRRALSLVAQKIRKPLDNCDVRNLLIFVLAVHAYLIWGGGGPASTLDGAQPFNLLRLSEQGSSVAYPVRLLQRVGSSSVLLYPTPSNGRASGSPCSSNASPTWNPELHLQWTGS
jgi:hypothetical protein